MYCVICGTLLQAENQYGLVCRDCKQEHHEKRSTRGQAICVKYCYSCGKPYHPSDASIKHECCFAILGSTPISLQNI